MAGGWFSIGIALREPNGRRTRGVAAAPKGAPMSDEKRPDEEKKLKDEELDKVSGGVGVREEVRRGGGVEPERERGINPEERLK